MSEKAILEFLQGLAPHLKDAANAYGSYLPWKQAATTSIAFFIMAQCAFAAWRISKIKQSEWGYSDAHQVGIGATCIVGVFALFVFCNQAVSLAGAVARPQCFVFESIIKK
jgi:hypothetical protein